MLHVHGNPDSEEEWLDMEIGRGPGDPDRHGHYPGEPDEADCEACRPKDPSQNKNVTSGLISQ
jgi:hypothetical protein